jgi:hypothetical protein
MMIGIGFVLDFRAEPAGGARNYTSSSVNGVLLNKMV